MDNVPGKQTIIIFRLAALSVLLLAGCAPQTRFDVSMQPDWVSGTSQKYPAENYFVGKGKASALDVAAKNAREDMAETLPSLTGSAPSMALEQLVQQAEVVDAWQDKQARQHYALVVLEHATATHMLRTQLGELDARTRQLIKAATQGIDPLQKIHATHDALATEKVRDDLLFALQTLGVDASADAAVWSIAEMQVHLKSLLSNIDVAPRTHGDAQLGSAVVRGLDAAGFLARRTQADYVLKTVLQRSGTKWEQGRFVEQASLNVELLNQQQKVVSRAQWPLSAQATERALLEKEMMNEVASTLRDQLAETVLGLPAK